MGEEEGGLLPDLGEQLIEVVRRGRTGQREDALAVRHLRQQAVVGIVDQLAFLVFLDGFDRQAQLFLDLVVRAAVQVGDAGMDVEHGGDRVEVQLARIFLVVDVGAGQLVFFLARGAGDLDRFRIVDLVEAIDARFHRHPLQQMRQPARTDGLQLRGRLGGVGKLPRRVIFKCACTAHCCRHGHSNSAWFKKRLRHQHARIVW